MSNQIPVQDVTPKKAESLDLYAKREKIYTRSFKGIFRNLRLGGGALRSRQSVSVTATPMACVLP